MPDDDYSAELLILADLGVSEDNISKINSKPSAEKLITYYQNKAKPKEEQDPKKNMLKLKENMGLPLPKPEDLNDPITGLTFEDYFNPVSPKRAINNRWTKNSRILMIFDNNPNGEVF